MFMFQCDEVHYSLMYVSSSLPPYEKCAAFGDLFASVADIPVPSNVDLQQAITKVILYYKIITFFLIIQIFKLFKTLCRCHMQIIHKCVY